MIQSTQCDRNAANRTHKSSTSRKDYRDRYVRSRRRSLRRSFSKEQCLGVSNSTSTALSMASHLFSGRYFYVPESSSSAPSMGSGDEHFSASTVLCTSTANHPPTLQPHIPWASLNINYPAHQPSSRTTHLGPSLAQLQYLPTCSRPVMR